MSRIETLLTEHSNLRSSGINMIASENFLSKAVKNALASDLAGRYHSSWYGGSKFAVKIISETERLAREVFKVKHAIVTSLSGNMCDLAVMFAFSEPGEKVAMVPFQAGGYPLGLKKFHRKLLPLPTDNRTFQLDVHGIKNIILSEKPPLTILGASYIPFPHPVNEITKETKGISICAYDGSHVLGLIACKAFQDPIREGAEILMGSTHKSLYGPQGGIVLTNSDSHEKKLRRMLDFDLAEGIGLVDNPHMNRIAALGLTLEELSGDPDYGHRVVKNAKALAHALDNLGVHVKFKERGYTESHQIFLDIDEKKAVILCKDLEKAGIFIDIAARIGVTEVTHKGMEISDMEFIAGVISDVLNGKNPKNIKPKVTAFSKKFSK